MAFIKCPECGKRFSETEHTCPYCGYLLENQQPSQQETQSSNQSKQDCDNLQPDNQQVSSKQDCLSKPDHRQGIECQRQLGHTYVKCSDCGQEYDGELEACPNCGCPSEYQVKQAKKTPIETEVSHVKSHTPKKGSKNKKLILIVLPIIIIAGIVAVGMIYHHEHSYEYKMARLEKVATEFKATLAPDNRIITEKIDSIAQKVYYLKPDGEGYGGNNIKNIMMHDYVTNETKSILPESGKIEDFEFCDITYRESKMIKNRLFFIINSSCMWRLGSTGVFYIDIKDNSLHYVESCDEASFRENGEIAITKFYYLGEDEEYGKEETKREEYTLSTSLSDEAYADNRWEQKRKEERLAEEWRKRDIERIIEIDYTMDRKGVDHHYVDHAGTLDGFYYYDGVYTKPFVVPEGKVWQLKRISRTGYLTPPRFYYHKIVNGYFNYHGIEFENAEILYSGAYKFSILDVSANEGHKTVKIKFVEEVY